jgi:hypothetical protein
MKEKNKQEEGQIGDPRYEIVTYLALQEIRKTFAEEEAPL